jgi:hypothetical protein
MMNLRLNRSATLLATGMVTLLTVGCGSKSGLGDGGVKPGMGGAAGASQTESTGGSGGNLGAGGGVSSGGAPGMGGIVESGGMPGTGGSGGSPGTDGGNPDANPQVLCGDGSGAGLPAAARQCAQDGDCTIAITPTCCGADQALGEAKSQSSAYAKCIALPSGACNGLGCAKFLGYITDTGRTRPVRSTSSQPIDFVSVRCLNQLCTTDVMDIQDAGQDAPSAVDAAEDLAVQRCGDAGACGSGQACVLTGGGPAPRCLPAEDGGLCSFGLVPVDSCSFSGGNAYRPGCSDPVPVPNCVDLPDGCGDICACLCHLSASAGCYKGPGYTICSHP